jgi:hypothetical protein
MINNPDWLKTKVKPYFHQISLDCIEEIAAYMKDNETEEMDCDTCLVMQEILSDEIEDEEFLNFAIENLEELSSYIINGKLNIRIHRDIIGEMWFGSGVEWNVLFPYIK